MRYDTRLELTKDTHRSSMTDNSGNHLLRQWRLLGNFSKGESITRRYKVRNAEASNGLQAG